MRKLDISREYKTIDGRFARFFGTLYPTDAHEKERTGADHVIHSNIGWYWYDGPMAGYYLDDRGLKNYKSKPDHNDLVVENEYRQIQLSLL